MTFGTRRFWSRFGLGVVVALVAIQLVPFGRNHVNPPIVSEPAWDSPDTRELAKRACFDCHSNETQWPAYAQVAPVSWLIQRDVNEGREALNFSEWHRRQQEADDASEAIQDGEMPPDLYRLMHAHARLSDADLDRLMRGLAWTFGPKHPEIAQR